MYISATLFAQITVFLIFVWFTSRFVWPPIVRALDERATKIADGLAAAERGHDTLEQAARNSANTIREGKEKAAELIVQAESQASRMIDEAREAARIEAEKIVLAGRFELEQETARLKEALRQSVADLAIVGAEKILQREIDATVHADLLNTIKQEL